MEQKIAKVGVACCAPWLATFVMAAGCAEAPRIANESESADVTEEGKESAQGETHVAGGGAHASDVDAEPSAGSAVPAESVDETPRASVPCGSISIRSRDDVDDARRCAEIDGDLTVHSVGLTAIEAGDLPRLTRITGDLIISGPQATEPPHLASVTLAKLRTVEGAVIVSGVSVPGFGASGPLQELHLPALERIGAHDALGLMVYQAALKVLDLPALVTIEGSVKLDTLLELCTLRAERLESIAGEVLFHYLPQLSPAQLEPLRSAASAEVSERVLGCCAADADARVACEDFTDAARSLHCGGCDLAT
jgi:hypothetical protein